jgi:D-arabinose 1-dehydrogenase-like Zn-dependent alcohol dehydrogenase
MAAVIDGLGPEGRLIVAGAPAEPMSVSVLPLIQGRRSITGWPSGTSLDSQECLKFAKQMGVRPRIELFSLDEAPAAYARMLSGEARFRVVMTTS